MKEKKVKIKYVGSKGWLVFWIFVFFPVALVLLATSGRFQLNGQTYYMRYDGSKGWLCFWVVCGFPVAFVLLPLNGVALISSDEIQAVNSSATQTSAHVPIV